MLDQEESQYSHPCRVVPGPRSPHSILSYWKIEIKHGTSLSSPLLSRSSNKLCLILKSISSLVEAELINQLELNPPSCRD